MKNEQARISISAEELPKDDKNSSKSSSSFISIYNYIEEEMKRDDPGKVSELIPITLKKDKHNLHQFIY